VVTIKRRRWQRYLPFIPLLRLSLAVRKENPDLLHVQGTFVSPYLIYALFLAPRKSPKIVTVHGYAVEEGISRGELRERSVKWHLVKWLERRTVDKFDKIICVDSRLKKRLEEKFGSQAKEKSLVILNGIDTIRFVARDLGPSTDASGRRTWNNRFTILNAKALVPKNGQEYLIRAMPGVLAHIPHASLRLAGEGQDMERLVRIASNLELDKNVSFLGAVPNVNVPALMLDSDIVVIPSIRMQGVEEASSILLLEAMASGKPVIATDIGGLKESIEHGKTGLLVPDRDPNAIAEAIVYLYNSPSLAEKIATSAMEYVSRERTWGIVAEKHQGVYLECVSQVRG